MPSVKLMTQRHPAARTLTITYIISQWRIKTCIYIITGSGQTHPTVRLPVVAVHSKVSCHVVVLQRAYDVHKLQDVRTKKVLT